MHSKRFLTATLILLIPMVLNAQKFQCGKGLSENLQVNTVPFCNSRFIEGLPSPYKVGMLKFNNLLYNALLSANNLGGQRVMFPSGHQKIVYRSAYLAVAPLCMQSLAKRDVNTIINLYSGDLGYATSLEPIERRLAKANGIKNYIKIDGYRVDDNDPNKGSGIQIVHMRHDVLNHKIVEIINKIKSASGNVLVHCYSGEHDTGVIMGVLNKCYNKQSLAAIKQNTVCHMGNQTAYQRQVYQYVTQIIEQFPCQLLK